MADWNWTQQESKLLAKIASKTAAVMPFPAEKQSAQSARIERALSSDWGGFSYFAFCYFPHVCTKAFSLDHKEAFEEVEAAENALIGLTGYRGFAKTAIFGLVYGIWKIARGDVSYLVNTAATEKLSLKRSRFMLIQFQKNQRLIYDFPQLQTHSDDASEIVLNNKILIEALSIEQIDRGLFNPYDGSRPQLIVADDIDRKENIGNAAIGKKKKDALTQDVGGAFDPDKPSRLIWLGNLTHPNFAICQFEDELTLEIKAEHAGARPEKRKHLKIGKKLLLRFPLEDAQGRSRWEEQYPTALLPELRKKFGTVGYLREFMGQKAIEGKLFKYEWFKTWRTLPRKFKKVWLYADPARGKKGCYKAVAAIGWDGVSFYVIKVWIRRTENSSLFAYYWDAFTEMRAQYGSRFRAGWESNFKQDDMLDFFDTWCDQVGKERISHFIKRIYNYDDKDADIESLDTVIETGKLLFPDGQDFNTLRAQFLIFDPSASGKEKDGPDCIARCMKQFETFGKRRRVRASYQRY